MPGPKMVRPSSDSAARISVSASEMVGGLLKPRGELAEDRRADADDDGEHQNLDAGRHHVAEHLLGEERGAAEEAERHEDEAGERRQLELDQADEELDRHHEEADDDDQPGDEQDDDLHQVREDAGEAHHAGDRGQDRLAGVDADLGDLARLKKLRGAHRAAARLDAEAGEGVVDDLREVVVVADDEGEDADIERLLDQPREHVLVGRHRPEQAGERDVDGDEDAGEPAHVALHQAEAGIDVLGEGPQEIVDDAGAAHDRLPVGGFRSCGRRGRGARGRRIGEEAAAALGPGGFAGGVILRLHGERLTPLQFVGERIGGCARS